MFNFLRRTHAILLPILLVLSIVSIGQGYANSQSDMGSIDFQWSPANILSQGTNPQALYLSGDKPELFLFSQAPNYAHGLTVLLLPLGVLSFDDAKLIWASFNIMACFLVIFIFGRKAELPPISFMYFALITLCSTPFRNTIGIGQQSLFVLLCFCGIFVRRNSSSSIISGLTYLKYTFAPPLAFYTLRMRGLLPLVLSSLPALVGYLIFLSITGGPPFEVFFQPVLVAGGSQGVSFGIGDAMSLGRIAFDKDYGALKLLFAYFLPIGASIFVILKFASAKDSPIYSASIVSMASLMFYNHLSYDYVFLLPVFAYAVKHRSLSPCRVMIALIIFNWYGLKMLGIIFNYMGWVFYPNINMIIVIFLTNSLILTCLILSQKELTTQAVKMV